MGCNCGKKRKPQPPPPSEQQFQLVLPDGRKSVFKSRLEAEAANIRVGKRGTIVTATF